MIDSTKYDCIIIGGGGTGAGIARDLSLRGLSVILLEKNDLAEGTTGRCHAMLHSGARYVYKDQEAAEECAIENKILLKIAPHISESCGGYFLGISDEDITYGDKFLPLCNKAKVPVEEITPQELLTTEPNCNPLTRRVFKVNDGYIDPFLLTIYNALDAKNHGAKIQTYCEGKELILHGNQVIGVKYFDKLSNVTNKVFGKIIINATGPWAGFLEKDLKHSQQLQIAPTMGTLLVIKDRLVNSLINRLNIPGDGDIFVPSHQSVLLGTTSIPVELSQLDNLQAKSEEIQHILTLGEDLIPSIRKHRLIRFYSGARPLVAAGSNRREASRKFEIIDYEKLSEHPYSGFITIFGGKLTTYRLMAENVSDLVCKKLGIHEKCQTAEIPLPGGENPISEKEIEKLLHVDSKTAFDMSFKWGTFYADMVDLCSSCMNQIITENQPVTVCNCENVTENELQWVHSKLDVKVLDDYRRRTRQGMGSCQGQFCFYKVADLETQWTNKSHSEILQEMQFALKKRWKTQGIADPMIDRQIKLSKYMYLMAGNLEGGKSKKWETN